MATIKDVAQQANVSIATVSHVINGTRYVSEELQERVRAAMNELGYRPNRLARGLRMGQTKIIGLIVPDNSNPFFAETAHIIEDVGYAHGYSVILCNSDYNAEKEETYVDILLDKQVDGIILIPSRDAREPHAPQQFRNGRTPFVIVGRDISGSHAETVTIDYQLGGYLATKHLIDLGHRRIACITGPQPLASVGQRLPGYYQALEEAGVTADPALIVPGDFRTQGGEAAMTRLLALDKRPTAVFAFNDFMAIGAIKAVRQQGLRIPADISIVGYDDISFAALIDPPLTTVAQSLRAISQTAVTMLLRQINSQSAVNDGLPSPPTVIQPRLVVRQSTAALERA